VYSIVLYSVHTSGLKFDFKNVAWSESILCYIKVPKRSLLAWRRPWPCGYVPNKGQKYFQNPRSCYLKKKEINIGFNLEKLKNSYIFMFLFHFVNKFKFVKFTKNCISFDTINSIYIKKHFERILFCFFHIIHEICN
jgi:hypothetical protein